VEFQLLLVLFIFDQMDESQLLPRPYAYTVEAQSSDPVKAYTCLDPRPHVEVSRLNEGGDRKLDRAKLVGAQVYDCHIDITTNIPFIPPKFEKLHRDGKSFIVKFHDDEMVGRFVGKQVSMGKKKFTMDLYPFIVKEA